MAFWGICILNEIPSVPTTFSCSITWITLCSSLETIFFSREIRETTNWKHILELFGDPWKSTMPIMLLPGDTWLFCTHNFAISPFASLILAWIGGFFAELEICSKKLRKASVLLASNDLRYSLHNGWYSLAWKGGNCKWNIPLFNKSRICRVSHKSKVTRAFFYKAIRGFQSPFSQSRPKDGADSVLLYNNSNRLLHEALSASSFGRYTAH